MRAAVKREVLLQRVASPRQPREAAPSVTPSGTPAVVSPSPVSLPRVRPTCLIAYDDPDWAFAHRAKAWVRAFPEWDVTFWHAALPLPSGDYDLFIPMWWPLATRFAKVRARRTMILLSNEYLDESAGVCAWQTDPAARTICLRADVVVAANRRLAGKAEAIFGRPVRVQYYGADADLFPELPPPSEFTVGWCGRDSRPDDFKGRALIREACRIAGVNYVEREFGSSRVPHVEMSEAFYRHISVYAVGSKSEGDPDPTYEALLSGRPIIATNVGVVAELREAGAPVFIVEERTPEAFARAIAKVRKWPTAATARRARSVGQLFAHKALAASWRDNVRAAIPDVSDEMTVFVLTVDAAAQFEACMAALEWQTVRPRIEVIRNVAPLAAAMQAQLDRCQTPFYAQLDEDTVLCPDAVERALGEMHRAAANVVETVFPLYDPDLKMPLQGWRVFRTELARRFPFDVNAVSTDWDQTERMGAAGLQVRFSATAPIGLHAAVQTPRETFATWHRRAQKFRVHPEVHTWVEPRAAQLFAEWRADPSPVTTARLLGFVYGSLGDVPPGSLDFRVVRELWERVASSINKEGG